MRLTNLQKNFYIFFSVIISILIATVLWDKITIPLNNDQGVIRSLTETDYNPINDTLRYLFFIFFPLIVFIFFKRLIKKKNLKIREIIFEENDEVKNNSSTLIIFSLVFIAFIIFEFMSLNLFNYRLDLFHDGDLLTPPQNYLSTKKFWLASYTVHGGSNIFYPLLMWKILGTESIGAARTYILFLILLVKLFSVALSYQLTKISNLNRSSKISLFVVLACVLVSMSHYEVPTNYSYFSYRDIYIILFLIFFLELFIYSRFRFFFTILISLIASVSILFHIDAGLFLNLILFFYILYLFIIKKNKEVLLIFCSLTVFWFIGIYLISFEEFKAFLDQTKTAILTMNLIHALKYPVPFFSIGEFEHGARATRGLLLQLSSGFFILNYLYSNKKKIFNSKKILFIFIFLLSLIMYQNALGRSDATHLRMSADLPILINCFFILNYLLFFLEKKKAIKKISSQKVFFSLSIISLVLFYIINHENYRFNNIKNFNKNFTNFIHLDDKNFIDQKTIKLLKYYGKISEKDNCIQIFTYDSAIPYLLRKPSCTRYYYPLMASSITKQKDYIKELKRIQPEYILYDSLGTNFNLTYKYEPPELFERLELVNSYILFNYKKYSQFDGYIFFKRK
jgi:hypothetical protein